MLSVLPYIFPQESMVKSLRRQWEGHMDIMTYSSELPEQQAL